MNVHVSRLSEFTDKGWREISRKGDRIELRHPDHTCLRPMRTGVCLMDKDHRGRCATAVHGCDACGKTRRGSTPASQAYDGNGDPDVAFCWFCVHVAERSGYAVAGRR